LCAVVGDYYYKISARYENIKKSIIYVLLFNLRDIDPHPYKMRGKIKARFILIDQK